MENIQILTPTNFINIRHLITKYFLINIDPYLKQYLGCLDDINRWQQHIFPEVTSLFKETDYDHIIGNAKIISEIRKQKTRSINYDIVELENLFHDGKEIITNDMSLYHSPRLNEFVVINKRIESKSFIFDKIILGKLGKNYNFEKEFFKQLHHRYETRRIHPEDTESHLVKLVDILQSGDFGLRNVYNKYKLMEIYGDQIPVDPDSIGEKLITREIKQTRIVLKSIKDAEDRQKIYDYIKLNHFLKYNNPNYGYQNLYYKYKNQMDLINPSILVSRQSFDWQ